MLSERTEYYVLIVDDNDTFSGDLKNDIGRLNYGNPKFHINVETAKTGSEAERQIHTGRYDLFVLDTCLTPPESEQKNYKTFNDILRGSIKFDNYASSLLPHIQGYCPHAKVFVVSKLSTDRSKIEFGYAPLEYFQKGDSNITRERIAQRIINYFAVDKRRILNNIFIVYGHNHKMRDTVSKYIRSLQISVLDLYSDSRPGIKHVFGALRDCSAKAECAIILLSADDIAIVNSSNGLHKLTYRARQNVIFEMGLFAGILGDDKVIVLYEPNEQFEFPSDINGIFYIPFDEGGKWKVTLKNDLKKIGFY